MLHKTSEPKSRSLVFLNQINDLKIKQKLNFI
jgi:hypothetical protein